LILFKTKKYLILSNPMLKINTIFYHGNMK